MVRLLIFKKRILEHKPHFSEDNIDLFWNKLTELVEFHHIAPMPVIDLETSSTGKTRSGTYQRGVMNGKFYEVKISDDEYFRGGATKETLGKAEFF